MARQRISLDLDLSNPWEKEIWDYLCTKKVKSKELRRILFNYINDIEDKPVFKKIEEPPQKESESKLVLTGGIDDLL